MRHLAVPLAAAAAVVAFSSAWAISPHFLSASASVLADGALDVAFKEAGLGNSVTAHYVLTTDAVATYQCFNNGSNTPQGQPYELGPQTLTASGDFTSGRNGSITADLQAGPPDPAPADAVLKCTSTAKKLCLVQVSYSNISLVDETYSDTATVTPGSVERSFPAPTRRNPNPPNCISS